MRTGLCLRNLGLLHEAEGDLAGARGLHKRALAIRRKVYGPDHHQTAVSFEDLGFVLSAEGDLAEARPLCERALTIRETVLGPLHPDTVASRDRLACLLANDGDASVSGISKSGINPGNRAVWPYKSHYARLLIDPDPPGDRARQELDTKQTTRS
jgi:hypothetical protein